MPARWIRRIMMGILTSTFTGLIELTAEYWIRQNAVFKINESIRSIRDGQRPVIMTEMTVAVSMINDYRPPVDWIRFVFPDASGKAIL